MEEARQGAGFPGDSAPVLTLRIDCSLFTLFTTTFRPVPGSVAWVRICTPNFDGEYSVYEESVVMISCAHAAIVPSLATQLSKSVPVNGSLSEKTNPIPLYRPVASAFRAGSILVHVVGSFVLAGKCVRG